MPIFNFKPDAQPISDDYQDVLNFVNGSNNEGWVSAEEALKNSDIYSAVMQLANDLATVEYTSNKPSKAAFVKNPAATTNGHAFWTSVFSQLLLGGEAFVYRWRNVNGVDLRWEYLRPSQVQPLLIEDGSGMIYNLNFDEPTIGLVNSVPQNDVLHFRLVSQNGGLTAISPLAALASELQVKSASNRLTLDALKQSVTSPGILKVANGGLLNAKEKAARSRQFMTQQHNSNGGPIVIDDLENYTPLEVKSNVAALLKQTDWTSKQIAKVFGIPDSFLNGQGDQQSSIDQIASMYTKALNRYALAVVSELTSKLSGHWEANLWPSVDPMGSNYAAAAVDLTKAEVINGDQARWLLQQSGYLPDNLPTMKGGEKDDNNRN